ncbi:hypothetical protein [Streptomyces sp. CC208A]|uniref:hypothetical protein n=1 Tax=Streptomyces sp. CC208A TaxID=3044573 RepID=UPI0024A975A2|nr:hypothetical protein [Streptomyces sp. CC208A]
MKRSFVRLTLAFTAALGLVGLGGVGTASAGTTAYSSQYFYGWGTGSSTWTAENSAYNDAYMKASFAGYSRYMCNPVGIPFTRQMSPYMYWSDVTVLCTKWT